MTSANAAASATDRGMHLRPFDIVLYGATGFTGQLIARYLAKCSSLSPRRWAIAGRSEDKLRSLRAELTSIAPECAALEIIIADTSDPATLVAMASKTRVVLTTVGPYAFYGEPLVAACIEGQADYCDLTGEMDWYYDMVDKYHDKAVAAGVMLVPSCGLESVPFDVGAYWLASMFDANDPIRVDAYLAVSGWFSGGTLASALSAMSRSRAALKATKRHAARSKDAPRVLHFSKDVHRWAIPMPTIEPHVVARSAMLAPEVYGRSFHYNHFLQTKNLRHAVGFIGAATAMFGLAQVAAARAFLQSRTPPGTGPDEAVRAKSWFCVTFMARSRNRRLCAEVRGGDAGYDETAKMISEIALCMAQDRIELPGRRGGLLTPSGACGMFLKHRLDAAGLNFRLVERTTE